MTSTKSGWFTATLLAALVNSTQTGTPTHITLSGNDANMYTGLTSSATVDYTAPVNYNAAAPAWVNGTDEIFGTGWATGGVLNSTAAAGSTNLTQTCVQGGSGPYYLQYSWTNALSVPSTTLTGIYGFVIYYHDITAGVSNKPPLLGIYVGTGYNTVSGTLGITPSGSGLSQITLTQ